MKRTVLAVAVIAVAMCGCPKSQTVQRPAVPPVAEQPAKAPFAEQPQPTPAAPAAQPEQQPAAAQDEEFVGSKGPAAEVWGWRVQIFVSSTRENARKVAEEARWKFGDQQIFITEAYPYFKVQVGSNLTRQDAENLKARAKKLGYAQAYAVEVDLTR
ncbi:MAG TPA: SPOR domain-containing protein [Candidatus Edwardsbacteria bacterium]|nr:SPOR domain-containing protein [Candidatus Edwardsbacteria bacterium]